MCEYCDFNGVGIPKNDLMKEEVDFGEFGKKTLYVNFFDEGTLYVGLDIFDDLERKVKINFCPMCGRKLKKI